MAPPQPALYIIFSYTKGAIGTAMCQTLFYGIYLCLAPIAIHAMIINGVQSRARKWLLAIITIILALMTVLWIVSVVLTLRSVEWCNDTVTACYSSNNASDCIHNKVLEILVPIMAWQDMVNNILFVNFIIADGIIVWRAWVLCSDQNRLVLMIPVVLLAINSVAYLMILAASVILIVPNLTDPIYYISSLIITFTQIAHVALSLLVNIFATSIIALKAWKYRKLLMESGIGIRTPRQAIRILALLVESGMIYILIGVTVMTLVAISARVWDLALSTNVGMQLVGIYPIAVVILVEKNRSLNSTFCSFGTIIDVRGDRLPQAEPMAFASGPVLASGGQIDLATKPPSSSTHDTFDHSLEPRDARTDTGNNQVSSEEHAA